MTVRPMTEGEREKLAATLLKTTEQMAVQCSAPQNLWNLHSNACLQAVDALSLIEGEDDPPGDTP